MHIFLTGDIQVGKSTIIQKLITRLEFSSDGFITYWERSDNGSRLLYLSPCNGTLLVSERHLLARDESGIFKKSSDIDEIFSSEGVKAFKSSGNYGITVMDELGFLESNAMEFQIAVLKRLSSENPVLGVIKPMHTPFLDAVCKHPNVELYEVTRGNRDELFISLLSKLENRRKTNESMETL